MADGIVLVGMPGSGKTTVGRLVAQRLGRPFIDTDEQIEHTTGRTPAQLIEADGEAAFRALERHVVSMACAFDGAVIAAGGGAVLDPLNRWAFMEHGVRVRLDVGVFELARRIESSGTPRPLLGDALVDGLRHTAIEREPFYQAVDITVDGNRDVATVVTDVSEAGTAADSANRWRMLYQASFDRHDTRGPEQGRLVMGVGLNRTFLDETVRAFAGSQPAILADARAIGANQSLADAVQTDRLCSMDGGEDAKTMARLEQILAWLTSIEAERSDPLVVVGGGTLGDVGGLAAALHRRGMPLVHVPTTWLAQADSSIGGKVAVDLPGAKNAIGAFWPAWLIVSDANLIDTLPVERRRDGMTECLKAGLIGDPSLWALVEERGAPALAGEDRAAAFAMTDRAVRLKLVIVDRDPHERGERRVLNLGHTIGHALEVESGYRMSHGEAVALGLRAVARIATGRGAEGDLADRIDQVLAQLGIPLRRAFDDKRVRDALGSDKKRIGGRQRWILPMAVGRVVDVDDVTDAELDLALRTIAA